MLNRRHCAAKSIGCSPSPQPRRSSDDPTRNARRPSRQTCCSRLTSATRFFVDALAFDTVGEIEDYPAVFVSDGNVLVTLWQVADPATATAFDRRANIGLPHVALKVADHAASDALHEKLEA